MSRFLGGIGLSLDRDHAHEPAPPVTGKGQMLGDLTNLFDFEHLGACGVYYRSLKYFPALQNVETLLNLNQEGFQ